MEYGYGLYKASASDGCQYVTIKNCVITLSNINNASGTSPMVDGSVGINVMNATFAASTTVLAPTARAGTNSYNQFYSNTIRNCNIGIALIGYAASSPFASADTLNDIGGTSAATGNQIFNFGGAAAAANPSAGIRTLAQYGLNVSYNTINNNNGSGTNHPNTLRGIFVNTAASASYNCNYNTVTINGGGTTSEITAIELTGGNTASLNTINVTGNTVENCTYTTATTGVFYGINVKAAPSPTNVNIVSNVVRNNTVNASTGIMYGIAWNNPVNLIVNNNEVYGLSRTGAGIIYGLNGASASNEKVTNNTIYDLSNTSVSSSNATIYGIYQNNTSVLMALTENTPAIK